MKLNVAMDRLSQNGKNYVISSREYQGTVAAVAVIVQTITQRIWGGKLLNGQFFGAGWCLAGGIQFFNLVVKTDHLKFRYCHIDRDVLQREHIHNIVASCLPACLGLLATSLQNGPLWLALGFMVGDRILWGMSPGNSARS